MYFGLERQKRRSRLFISTFVLYNTRTKPAAKGGKLVFRQAGQYDAKTVSALYSAVRGTEFCVWDESYPGEEEINSDLAAGCLYVLEDEGKIIGCGAIGPYWGREDESSLFTIFVLPEYQGKGIGRKIVETLEQDEYFLRAKRIEIPASITGVPFYLKMGYHYKNGISEPDEEHLIRMEKNR